MSSFAAIFGLATEDNGTFLFGLVAFTIAAVPCAIHDIFTICGRFRELKNSKRN